MATLSLPLLSFLQDQEGVFGEKMGSQLLNQGVLSTRMPLTLSISTNSNT
jgi:hypothetical protein